MTDTANTTLPIAPRSTVFDKNSEIPKLREFAKATDTPTAEYGTYFFYVVDGATNNFTSYHLPFVGIIDGTPQIIPRAVFGAAAAIQGARSGAKLPDAARTEAKASIEKVYIRMAKLFDDTSIEAPWLSSSSDDDAAPATETKAATPATETRSPEQPVAAVTQPVAETIYRTAEVESIERSANPDDRILNLSFSSETPVQRAYGMEILDHSPDSVDLSRLNAAGPVLLDHDTTKLVGVVQKAWVSPDKKGRATVKISNSALGTEVFNDIAAGIRKNVSVGYAVSGKPTVTGNTYRFTSWTPSHVAFVSEPADFSVGIARALDSAAPAFSAPDLNTIVIQIIEEPNSMTTENPTVAPVTTSADAIKAERSRVNEIRSIAKQFNLVGELQTYADKAVADGIELSEFQTNAFKMLESKAAVTKMETADLGMTKREARGFSITRMANHLLEPTNKRLADAAGFEIEACNAAEKKYGATRRDANSFILPYDVTRASRQNRNINLTSGADAVETEVDVGSWVDYLYNATQVISAGATVLGGLVNSIQIPVTSAANAAYWLATDGTSAVTESDITIAKINLAPHNAAAYTAYTRALLQQVPGLDAILERNLAQTMAVALDAAYLNGSGSSGQPTGIANTSGIGAITFGSGNGGAPTYAKIMSFVRSLAAANALTVPGHKAFLIEANGQETLATTLKTSGDTTSNFILGGMTNDLTKMAGYDVLLSNNVLSNLTVGTEADCSQVFFGNWSEAVIGMFYTEFLVNPYLLSTTNQIALFAYQGTDIALKHAASFAVSGDMITGQSTSS